MRRGRWCAFEVCVRGPISCTSDPRSLVCLRGSACVTHVVMERRAAYVLMLTQGFSPLLVWVRCPVIHFRTSSHSVCLCNPRAPTVLLSAVSVQQLSLPHAVFPTAIYSCEELFVSAGAHSVSAPPSRPIGVVHWCGYTFLACLLSCFLFSLSL